MSASSDAMQFAAKYETSPIYLLNGLAANVGGVMALTYLLTAAAGPQVVKWLKFRPIPGGQLLKYECATYPMANQAVAGNAMIAMPVNFSMEMVWPATSDGVPYLNKNAVVTGLVSSLQQHAALGGTYTVYTPAYTYPPGVLLNFSDTTTGDIKQAQALFQMDFYFPLLTVAQVQAAQGSLYQAINGGQTITGQPSFSTGASSPSALPGSLTPPTIQ